MALFANFRIWEVKAKNRSVSGSQNFNFDFHFGLKKFDWIIFRQNIFVNRTLIQLWASWSYVAGCKVINRKYNKNSNESYKSYTFVAVGQYENFLQFCYLTFEGNFCISIAKTSKKFDFQKNKKLIDKVSMYIIRQKAVLFISILGGILVPENQYG